MLLNWNHSCVWRWWLRWLNKWKYQVKRRPLTRWFLRSEFLWPQPSEPILNNFHVSEISNLTWNSLRRTVAPQKPRAGSVVKLGFYGKNPKSANISNTIWTKTVLETSWVSYASCNFLAVEVSKHKSSKFCSEHHLRDSRFPSLMENQTPKD